MDKTGDGEDRGTGEVTRNETGTGEVNNGTGAASENRTMQGDRRSEEEGGKGPEQTEKEDRAPAGNDQPRQSEEVPEAGEGNGNAPGAGGENEKQDPQRVETTGCGSMSTTCRPQSWLRHTLYIPPMHRAELCKLSALSTKLFFIEVLVFLIGFVNTALSGQLGGLELASAALAIAVFNIAAVSTGIGLAQTCDTLVSQTYGSGNMKRVGVLLLRAALVMLLLSFPCAAVLLFTEPFLLLINQDPECSRLAQKYILILLPAVPACFLFQLQVRFLQNQNIVLPQIVAGAIVNVINLIANYIILQYLHLGILWSAVAAMVAHYLFAVILFVLIITRGTFKATWPGWSLDILQEWGSFCKEAFLSTVMLCAEFWVFEIWLFLAGTLGTKDLEVQTVIYNIYVVVFLVSLGLAAATSVRVGNALGAGKVDEAKLSKEVALKYGGVVAVVVVILMLIVSPRVGYIFTSNMAVIGEVGNTLPLFCITFLIDTFATLIGGVIRGAGRLNVGAGCNVLGHLIGLTIGWALMDRAKLGIKGLWLGITFGVLLIMIAFVIFLCCKINFQKEAKEAQARAGVLIGDEMEMDSIEPSTADSPKDQPDQVVGTTENDKLAQDGGATQNYQPAQRCVTQDDLPALDGGATENNDPAQDEGASEHDQPTQDEGTVGRGTRVVGCVLSMKQLLVRRIPFLLLMVSIFVVALVIRIDVFKNFSMKY